MTRDEIIALAVDAYTIGEIPAFYPMTEDALERFANLVVEKYKNDIFGLIGVDDWIEAKPILFPTTESLIAEAVAKEREACAKLCIDSTATVSQFATPKECVAYNDGAMACAQAIRARGQK